MKSFIDLVKDNINLGRLNLDGVKVSEEFSAIKEIRPATSIESPKTISRTDESSLKFTTYGITSVAGGSYTGQTPNGIQMKTEFMTDSQLFEIKTVGSVGSYSIFCDGKLINEDAFLTPNGEAVSWIQVKANDGVKRKVRHFEIYSVNTAIGAIQANAQDTFSSNIIGVKPLIYQMGDSYTYGTGAALPGRAYGSSPAVNDFYAFSRSLGFDGIAEGIGGSGWNSTAGQYPSERVKTRLAKLNREPAVISWSLGYNDAAAINTGTNKQKLVQSMIECLAETRKYYPSTPIIIISPATPKGMTANIQVVYDLVKKFASENGIDFIDISSKVTAANSIVYTGSDNVHPNGEGHEFRGLSISFRVIESIEDGKSLNPVIISDYRVNYIERLKFSVLVKTESVSATSRDQAKWLVFSRQYDNPDLRIEILRVE